VWRLQQDALSDFVVKEQGVWKSKDPARKPQITLEMLAFLNRAQMVANGFFAAGSSAPRLNYVLRPTADDKRLGESKIEIKVDGTPHVWTTDLQHPFTWPPPATADGAVGRLRNPSAASVSFVSWPGPWGVFRMFGDDAEPRELNARIVEWRYTSSGRGRRELIEPAPVQLEFVMFPGGQDFFNPRFWRQSGCPAYAVQ
jgi:type VI protein secretion system component VasK